MIRCPNCNEQNDSVTMQEMKRWKQKTVDFRCGDCGYECDWKPDKYAPYMELDKNGC